MKKLTVISLLFALALVCAGCGSAPAQTVSAPAATEAPAEPTAAEPVTEQPEAPAETPETEAEPVTEQPETPAEAPETEAEAVTEQPVPAPTEERKKPETQKHSDVEKLLEELNSKK